MAARGVGLDEAASRGLLTRLVTEQLRLLLEQRSVRLAAIGGMLVMACLFSLAPTPMGADPAWMFIVPVAIAAIAGGLREGVATAFAASALTAVFAAVRTGHLDVLPVLSVVAARFALYGLTSAILGAFAEAHHSVQSSLRALATTDPMTKVANVARFYEELGALERLQERFAVMLVDVDDLKTLNDRYGHQAGSAAIMAVADALRRVVRGSDHVARYGGDEFVVILKDADRQGAEVVAGRLRDLLERDVDPHAPGMAVSVSIGIALFDEDGATSDELLAAADAAMYEEKRRRKLTRV